jgi:hypothetical protein
MLVMLPGVAAVSAQDAKPAEARPGGAKLSDSSPQTSQQTKPEDPQAGQPRPGPNTGDSDAATGSGATGDVVGGDSGQAQAQPSTQTPAPSPEVKAPYVINWSTEFGWRFKGVEGNQNEYRSQLDYDRGMRLFSGNFFARPGNGSGPLFDNLLVNSVGWGGDPTQYTHAQIDKAGWYRFIATYRRFAYFNDLANLALGQHTADTTYEIGDFNLTLFPQNRRFSAYLGYSLERIKGNSMVTYDYSRNEFPILSPFNTRADDYVFGVNARLWIFDIGFEQGFRFFKNDTTYDIAGPEHGNSSGPTMLATFHRDLPTRGRIPFTELSLHPEVNKKLDITARFIYASATTDSNLFETVTGTDNSGHKIILDEASIVGNAKRPNALGNLGISYLATKKLTISDSFRYNSFRINGGDQLLETLLTSSGGMPLPPTFTDTLSFQLLSYRVLWNAIEADYAFNPRLSAHLGYAHGDRRVIKADFTVPPGGNLASPEVTNNTDSVFGGFRAKPYEVWTLYFDFDHGTADNVFTRVSNYNYTNFRARSLIRPRKTLAINASLVTNDNTNPTLAQVGAVFIPFGVNFTTRIFSASADWTPGPRLSLSGGYTYSHIDTNAAIVFFLNSIQTPGTSKYFLRDNFVFATANIQLHPRATLLAGFRVNHDNAPDTGAPSPRVLISVYPYQRVTPEARLSINVRRQLDWNAGWQYFDYHDKLFSTLSYRANLGYVSLTVHFDKK